MQPIDELLTIMLLSRLLVTGLLTIVTGVAAGTNLTLADLPSCALPCLLQTVPAVGCGLLDTKCQCESKPLETMTNKCVIKVCNKSELLLLSKIQSGLCNLPDQSRQREVLGWIYTGVALILLTTGLRFLSRWKVNRGVFIDDYMLLGGIVSIATITGCSTIMVIDGVGKHFYQVDEAALTPALLYFWIAEIFYVLVKMFVKFALILFFIRVFVAADRFRIACCALFVSVAALSIMWVLLLIFQCRPVSSNWNINVVNPKCRNVRAYAYAGAGATIAQDLMILLFPIPLLVKLNMERRKKLELIAIFSVGVLVIITSTVRLHSIRNFGSSSDPTWDNIPISIWTTIELTVGIICCNMPAISSLIKKYTRSSAPPSQQNSHSIFTFGSPRRVKSPKKMFSMGSLVKGLTEADDRATSAVSVDDRSENGEGGIHMESGIRKPMEVHVERTFEISIPDKP